ncbi:hypothetical protein BDA99DRAFT_541495 [Phascolomyces articulosus]|uniref:Uncharacterized protein n=1 Tax=Phascolomyces articulosus TaxID=60185 RepID=A0AAD5K202_9FUNG|nr:hypothetical protein BDA99DRAFT_541495 [Phascolomyces articulosus]
MAERLLSKKKHWLISWGEIRACLPYVQSPRYLHSYAKSAASNHGPIQAREFKKVSLTRWKKVKTLSQALDIITSAEPSYNFIEPLRLFVEIDNYHEGTEESGPTIRERNLLNIVYFGNFNKIGPNRYFTRPVTSYKFMSKI